ncbi:hypothetical protein RchiOBHm_Chr4g0427221 [Rosa chinensis]|uniref:Uncharacterized protein n=1 Tax=Rosa chinensis TaxID=74649 RepID=A0A2P6QZP3_ROSCH|nr:hypothetical protein RchiOBHm_Chr4g0427221 [Rosa chinensis]
MTAPDKIREELIEEHDKVLAYLSNDVEQMAVRIEEQLDRAKGGKPKLLLQLWHLVSNSRLL